MGCGDVGVCELLPEGGGVDASRLGVSEQPAVQQRASRTETAMLCDIFFMKHLLGRTSEITGPGVDVDERSERATFSGSRASIGSPIVVGDGNH